MNYLNGFGALPVTVDCCLVLPDLGTGQVIFYLLLMQKNAVLLHVSDIMQFRYMYIFCSCIIH